MRNLLLAFTVLFITNSSCKKDKTNPVDQLPPETQTGANTFGCLVNGVAYIPKGFNGTGTPNPKVSLEFFNGKTIIGIVTKQIENGNASGFVDIYLSDNVLSPGLYNYYDKFNFSVGWPMVIKDCFTPAGDTTVKKWGTAVLTKFDNANRIVSGNFNLKFKTPTCDTVFITNGRFDYKF